MHRSPYVKKFLTHKAVVAQILRDDPVPEVDEDGVELTNDAGLRIEYPVVEESVDHDVQFSCRLHENETCCEFGTSGWGPGRHQGTVRFDLGNDTFGELIHLDWVGPKTFVELGFVPTAAIAVIDGSDEIRF